MLSAEVGPSLEFVFPTMFRIQRKREAQLDRARRKAADSQAQIEYLEADQNEPPRGFEVLVQLQETRFITAALRATRFKITGKKSEKEALKFPAYQLVNHIYRAWAKVGFSDLGVPILQQSLADAIKASEVGSRRTKVAEVGVGVRHINRLLNDLSPIVEIVYNGPRASRYRVHPVLDDDCLDLWQERVRVAYLHFAVSLYGYEPYPKDEAKRVAA